MSTTYGPYWPSDPYIWEELLSRSDLDPDSGCLVWGGKPNRGGYGVITLASKKRLTHRLAYELCIGPIPRGLLVRHRCDNPPCLSPSHLLLGTQRDNMADRIERHGARSLRGQARCINGHTLFAKNVGTRPNGSRFCLNCQRDTLARLAAEAASA